MRLSLTSTIGLPIQIVITHTSPVPIDPKSMPIQLLASHSCMVPVAPWDDVSIACCALMPLKLYRFSAPEITTNRRTGRRTMRAIGLVLLSIAIMALLLTDADAKRRSSVQGSQAAGASRSWCATYSWKGINDNCSFATQQQCLAQVWGLGGFCRPNPFPGSAYGTGYTWGSGSR